MNDVCVYGTHNIEISSTNIVQGLVLANYIVIFGLSSPVYRMYVRIYTNILKPINMPALCEPLNQCIIFTS